MTSMTRLNLTSGSVTCRYLYLCANTHSVHRVRDREPCRTYVLVDLGSPDIPGLIWIVFA